MIRPGCRTTSSSFRRCRSCGGSWKTSCGGSASPSLIRHLRRRLTMATDPIAIRKIDHVRFFVGNARQSAYFYRNAFGFDVVAYAGLETKVKHEAGYVLRQGDITFLLASPLSADHPDCQRLIQHGD